MKKVLFFLFTLIVFTSFGKEIKASYEEIRNSISLIEKYIKENEEDIISILSEAIEIEKRASTEYLAQKIKEKICRTSKIKEDEFKNLRKNFSFFDISIAWAISQTSNIFLEKVLKEKELKTWKELLRENINQKEKIINKIRELNPKSESF
ncbi:MAG: hypothetical protein NC915_05945 [Candidatus Omnitrophica bacterium]|nr:hypothetical protein [Candidatus Omnitrophota bacterium]